MGFESIFFRFFGSFCFPKGSDNFKFFYELILTHFRKFCNRKNFRFGDKFLQIFKKEKRKNHSELPLMVALSVYYPPWRPFINARPLVKLVYIMSYFLSCAFELFSHSRWLEGIKSSVLFSFERASHSFFVK